MKNILLVKVTLFFPVLLFVSYILMAVFGVIAGIIGFGNEFYCGPYCFIGKIVLGVALILFFYLISPDIKAILKTWKNTSSEGK